MNVIPIRDLPTKTHGAKGLRVAALTHYGVFDITLDIKPKENMRFKK